MGQAQRAQDNRHRSVQYRDVELELWELDNDDSDYGRRNSGAARNGRNRTNNGSRSRATNDSRRVNSRNIHPYEQRQSNTGQGRTNQRGISQSRSEQSRSGQNGGRQRSNSHSRSEQRNASQSRSGQSRTSQNRAGNRTTSQRPNRELQVQDIRRYQGNRAVAYSNVQSIYVGNARPVQSIRRRKKRRQKVYFARVTAAMFVVFCLVLIYYLTGEIYRAVHSGGGTVQTVSEKVDVTVNDDNSRIAPPAIIEDYLDVNDYSRPATPLNKINSIFVHYTANPGTSAAQNRSYFANLALTQERSASAHLIIGYEGEIVQCIPFNEQAYAVMTRNEDSISIECCYTSEDGSFTPETYDTLVHTLAWLIDKYDLSTSDILRHYDCGGKLCPVYYVENEEAWNQLLQDVNAYIAAEEKPEEL